MGLGFHLSVIWGIIWMSHRCHLGVIWDNLDITCHYLEIAWTTIGNYMDIGQPCSTRVSLGCHFCATWVSLVHYLDIIWMSHRCRMVVTWDNLDITFHYLEITWTTIRNYMEMSIGCHLDVTLVPLGCHLGQLGYHLLLMERTSALWAGYGYFLYMYQQRRVAKSVTQLLVRDLCRRFKVFVGPV